MCMELYSHVELMDKIKEDIENKYKCVAYIDYELNGFKIFFHETNYRMAIDVFRYYSHHKTYTFYDYECICNMICAQIEAHWREFLFK